MIAVGNIANIITNHLNNRKPDQFNDAYSYAYYLSGDERHVIKSIFSVAR